MSANQDPTEGLTEQEIKLEKPNKLVWFFSLLFVNPKHKLYELAFKKSTLVKASQHS